MHGIIDDLDGLRTLMDEAADGFVVVAPPASPLYANRRLAEMVGYDVADILDPEVVRGMLAPGEHEKLAEKLRRRAAGESVPTSYETELIRKDGTSLPVEISAVMATWQGKPASFAIFRDISGRVNAINDLRYHIEFENLVARMSTEFVNLQHTEIEDSITRWLAQLGKISGVDRCYIYQPSQSTQRVSCTHDWCAPGIKSVKHLVHNTPQSQFAWAAPRILNGETLHFPDISTLPIDAAGERDLMAEGAVVSWLLVPLHSRNEIVGALGFDRVRGEKIWDEGMIPLVRLAAQAFANLLERQRTDIKVSETELRLRSMIEGTSDAVFCYEYDPPIDTRASVEEQVQQLYGGILVDCNTAYTKAHGYKNQDEVLGRSNVEINNYLPGTMDGAFAAMIQGGYRMVDGESRRKTREGKEVFWLNNAYGVLEDNQVVRIWGTYRDITDRKRTELELQRKEHLESLGVLAGGIAHDFNNLLVVSTGFVDLAKKVLGKDHIAYGHLEKTLSVNGRMSTLTRQLLTFAKGGEPVVAQVQLEELLRETCDLSTSGSGIRCSVHVDSDIGTIMGDPGQLGQVFSNLIINARQSMAEDEGGVVEIKAIGRKLSSADAGDLLAGSYVEVSVSDKGEGIPAAYLERIFDPFFTTKEAGSGLGLATTFSIVNKHQGRISVTSEVGKGTVFRVLLPVAQVAESIVPEAPPVADLPAGKVLLMDDEELILDVTGCMLEELGYQVVTALRGEDALDLYRKAMGTGERFDLVILDVTIRGGMGGEKTIAEMRKIDPDVVAVVSSGYSDSPIIAKFDQYGFRGCLPKPYDVDKLVKILSDL